MKKKNIILLIVSIIVISILLLIGHLRTQSDIAMYVNTIPIKEAVVIETGRKDIYIIKRLDSIEGRKDTLLLISNNKYIVNDTIICHISSVYDLATEPSCKK